MSVYGGTGGSWRHSTFVTAAAAALLLTVATLTACGGSSAQLGGATSPAMSDTDRSASPSVDTGGTALPAGTETYFEEARDFADGVAWVRPAGDAWQCIDSQGQTLFTLLDTQIPITDFEGGVAIVEDQAAEVQPAWAVYGKTGLLLPAADDTGSYQIDGSLNGYAIVIREVDTAEGYESQTGLLDSSGSWFVEPTPALQMREGDWFSPYGLLEVVPPDGAWRAYKGADYFDTVTGEFVAAPTPKKLAELVADRVFQDGMVFVSVSEGGEVMTVPSEVDLAPAGFKAPRKASFMGDPAFYDSDRKLAIDLSNYSDVEPIGGFFGGYCTIVLGNSDHHLFTTIIDKTGRQMFEPIPDGDIGPFSQGRALLTETDGTCSYIDCNGVKVIEGIETGGTFAENGLALVGRTDGPPGGCFITTDGAVAF